MHPAQPLNVTASTKTEYTAPGCYLMKVRQAEKLVHLTWSSRYLNQQLPLHFPSPFLRCSNRCPCTSRATRAASYFCSDRSRSTLSFSSCSPLCSRRQCSTLSVIGLKRATCSEAQLRSRCTTHRYLRSSTIHLRQPAASAAFSEAWPICGEEHRAGNSIHFQRCKEWNFLRLWKADHF